MTNLEIEGFLTIVKEGSLSRAAKKLFVSQPALSRRMKALEDELGYTLVVRKKGIKNIELTEEGRAFIPVAKKWRLLWKEARDISRLDRSLILNIAAVDSVSTYILPKVYKKFLKEYPDINMSVRMLHSQEAYEYVESGMLDLAFISDDMYSPNVETIPAFTEQMLLICAENANYPRVVHPSMLDVTRQIRMPWNPEYDMWHNYWFDSRVRPRVFLDKMSLLEEFLFWQDNWAIVPASVAHNLESKGGIAVREIEDGPSDRIIYYLLGEDRKPGTVNAFLNCLKGFLDTSLIPDKPDEQGNSF